MCENLNTLICVQCMMFRGCVASKPDRYEGSILPRFLFVMARG